MNTDMTQKCSEIYCSLPADLASLKVYLNTPSSKPRCASILLWNDSPTLTIDNAELCRTLHSKSYFHMRAGSWTYHVLKRPSSALVDFVETAEVGASVELGIRRPAALSCGQLCGVSC